MRPSSPARPPLFSPRQKNLSKRLAAFALRFWPLWSVWLLIGALPVSREVLRLQALGSPLISFNDRPWSQSFGNRDEFNGFRAAKAHPRDLNARLWRFSLMMQGWGEDADYKTYQPDQLLREANAIRLAFPHEKWLVALPVRLALGGGQGSNNTGTVPPPNGLRPLKLGSSTKPPQWALHWVRQGAALEPNNAFYPLAEAQLWQRSQDEAAARRAVNRAVRCRDFDTHQAQITSRIIAAHEAIRPLLLEEKEQFWKDNGDSTSEFLRDWISVLINDGRAAQKTGNHRRVIETAVLLARLGDLMQRGKNTADTARLGNSLKNAAWNITPRSKAQQLTLRGSA